MGRIYAQMYLRFDIRAIVQRRISFDTVNYQEMRMIKSNKVQQAVIPGYTLTFPSPAAASIRSKKGSEVHGVIYDGLSKMDFVRLWLSEGASLFYDLEVVDAIPYEGNEIVKVATFVEKNPQSWWSPSLIKFPPTENYINFIRRGAKEQNLDESWRRKLNSITTIEEKALQIFMSNLR
mmetsp:Transcript_26910/g.37556  ORF Transcript_26910/g.37556 Transcript_26910/m.37556 type:complete len:178 (+) Transcript_26910:591-1124(+)